MLPSHQALRRRRILSFLKYNLGSHVLVGLSSLPRVFFQTGRSGGWLLRILRSHHHLQFEDGDKGKCSPSSMMDTEIWRLSTGDIVHHGSLRWWAEVERERKGIIITWSQLALWGSWWMKELAEGSKNLNTFLAFKFWFCRWGDKGPEKGGKL